MRRLTFLLLCLFIGIGVATAQTMKITGNVISSEDQQPVIGAAVVVKGTTIGTVTDFEGNFSLDVRRDAKMIFISYVGLKTKEVPVASVINVVLDSDSKALDEVVVTAMGLTREKKALGYALQEVKSDELTKLANRAWRPHFPVRSPVCRLLLKVDRLVRRRISWFAVIPLLVITNR